MMTNPIWSDRYESFDLDLEFLTNYGNAYPSPLLEYFLKDGVLEETEASQLANMIYRKYKENWSRQYEVLSLQYDILNTYFIDANTTVDIDSLENSLRELAKTNNDTQTQITKLLEDVKRTASSEAARSELEKRLASNTRTNEDSKISNNVNTLTGENVDLLEFLDREDVETRDLIKDKSNDINSNQTENSALSFDDRKDVTTTNRTEEGSENTDTTTTETGNSTTSGETEERESAFNSSSPVPVRESTTDESQEDGRTTAVDGTVDNNKTISGTDQNQKTGRELTDNELTRASTEVGSETDSGTIKKGIKGSEVNTKSLNQTDTDIVNETITGSVTKSVDASNDKDEKMNSSATSDSLTDSDKNIQSTSVGSENLEGSAETKKLSNETTISSKKGNIGITPLSTLIRGHLNLWRWNFLDQVYKDVHSMISSLDYN